MKVWRATDWPALAFAIRPKPTNGNTHLVTETPVRLSEPSLFRTTSSSLLKDIFRSTPNRAQEIDMENCNPFILNRQVHSKRSDLIALLLITASITLSGFAFVLPVLTTLMGSGEQ